MFFLGMAVSSLNKDKFGSFGEAVELAEAVDPEIILLILLPPLLFEYSMDIGMYYMSFSLLK